MYANTNAPPAVAYSAIIYALRCMVTRDIPLNQVHGRAVTMDPCMGVRNIPYTCAFDCGSKPQTVARTGADLLYCQCYTQPQHACRAHLGHGSSQRLAHGSLWPACVQGCLAPITVRIPPACLLNPSPSAAVVGGNVLTSQRVTDVVLKAFGAAAASQVGCTPRGCKAICTCLPPLTLTHIHIAHADPGSTQCMHVFV